jgi:acetyl esterase/lipase
MMNFSKTAAVLIFGLCTVLAGIAPDTAFAQTAFYAYTAAEAIGQPGSIIRIESMEGAPLGANAYRILYRSTGLGDEPIAVSGVVVVPAGDPPKEGRPIVAWAHPTTGIVPRCAPSEAFFVFQNMMGLRDMVRRGYIVAMTDYPGLGTEGPHPYLVGNSEARAVLDSVRAARLLAGAFAGDRYAVWGHSQGGQAALFVGMISGTYAPELHLVGVAVAAPATDLQTLLRDDAETDGGRNITAMTLWSWTRVYKAPLNGVIDPSVMPAVDALASECLESVGDMVERHYSQRPLETRFLTVKDITDIEPWRSLLIQNTPGTLPPDIPVFIAQGDADGLVRPAVTREYAARLCRAGSAVSYLSMPGVRHGFAGAKSAIPAVAWIADRFADLQPPSSCSDLVE